MINSENTPTFDIWKFYPGEMVGIFRGFRVIRLRQSHDRTSVFGEDVFASETMIVISVMKSEPIEQLAQFAKFDDIMVCGANKIGWVKANFLQHV